MHYIHMAKNRISLISCCYSNAAGELVTHEGVCSMQLLNKKNHMVVGSMCPFVDGFMLIPTK